jgi:hypothetical protein
MAAAISIVGGVPRRSIAMGRRKVPAAAPMREVAVAKPTPAPRISVGKTSVG